MKHSLKLLAVAVALALPTASFAAPTNIDMDDTTNANVPVKFAKELVKTTGTTITTLNPLGDSAVDFSSNIVTGKVGFGVNGGSQRYVRVTLTNAKFAGSVKPTLQVKADVPAGVTRLNNTGTAIADGDELVGATTAITGGNNGATYAIFQLQPGANFTVEDSDLFEIDIAAITALSTSADVKISYALYETASQASTNNTDTALHTIPAVTLAKFGTGLNFAVNTAGVNTADVTTLYKEFTSGSLGDSLAKIGTFDFGAVAETYLPDGATEVEVTDLVATPYSFTLTGSDLSAAESVSLYQAGSNCAGTAISSVTAANFVSNTATFNFATGSVTDLADAEVCYTALSGDNAKPIAAQKFTLSTALTAVSGATLTTPTPFTVGTFERDGTVLKAPFIQGVAGASTFVNFANGTGNDAPFTVRCLSATGAAEMTTAESADNVVPANASKRYAVNKLGCAAGAGYNAMEFIFAVPQGSVTGTVVRETSEGSSGFSDMTGNQVKVDTGSSM